MAQSKGYGEAGAYNAPLKTDTYLFKDNGLIPNSPLPLIVRQGAVTPGETDPARSFEETFRRNGWTNTWRNGIFQFHHYHSTAHEVLGIVSGSANVRFGGESGEVVALSAGDVVVVPAGVGHALLNGSEDLEVVGAYADGRDYDTIRDDPNMIAAARERIAQVPLPASDPVDGPNGPLTKLWQG